MSQTSAPVATVLRDGRAVTIRPLQADDSQALLAFGGTLPQDDWQYLQNDLRSAEVVSRLVGARDAEHWRQLVAVSAEGTIVAYSSARLLGGWSSHVADIQLLVADRWRHSGLGSALASEIVAAARQIGALKVIVDMVEEQTDGRSIFVRLGFRQEGLLVNHTRDREGNRHNLVVLGRSFGQPE